jgi:polysaccharide biosynthesis/export protein
MSGRQGVVMHATHMRACDRGDEMTTQSSVHASQRAARRWLCALAGFALVALAATSDGQSREALGEGDVLRITVFQNPDLTTESRISERGTITFPLVGEVALGGLTPAAAETRIAEQLEKGKFVLKPQVTVNVTKVRSRQVSVVGQVARPGRYPLEDASTSVTDGLAVAGGIAQAGDDKVVVLRTRDGKTNRLEVNVHSIYGAGDASSNIQLENGDTLYVPRAPVFYIYGEVQRGGSYRLEPTMTVMQAIAVGGGITPRGTERGLKVRRAAADGSVRTFDAALTDRLEPDDVVYVKESLF